MVRIAATWICESCSPKSTTIPPVVYELPLRPTGKNPVAKRIATTQAIAPGLNFLPVRNQPTGLDISADGSTAAVVTYYGVFLFPRTQNQTWAEALATPPIRTGPHGLNQAESVAFSKNQQSIFCISEGINSPIARFEKAE